MPAGCGGPEIQLLSPGVSGERAKAWYCPWGGWRWYENDKPGTM